MASGILSEADYVVASGDSCPNCKSSEVQATDYEPNGSEVISSAACDKCGSYWIEVYKLHGYAQLNSPDEKER